MNGKVNVLVLYDVQDDKLRRKVFQACLDQGLEHWQASVFRGDLSLPRRRELQAKLADLVKGHVASVHVQPIGAQEVAGAWIRT